MKRLQFPFIFYISLLFSFNVSSQQLQKGLLWEISGNGLSRPSYLYGTMHVSSKLAFNLSDSFFIAIKNCDRVALESSPENWLEELMSTEFMSQVTMLQVSGRPNTNDPINAGDFSWFKEFYAKEYVKQVLAKDPSMLNQLMFRHSYNGQDFEEDTYLDLYIFQIASKLNKPVVSVEDLDESLKLVMTAYTDMFPEDKERKDNPDFDRLLEDYYRQADLYQMDSLMKSQGYSESYFENMLYIRNNNMVKSMDSIMKTGSLFTGVGAAHLPGEKGLINLLRSMGYQVRAVQLGGRNAAARKKLDKLTVPLSYRKFTSADGMFSIDVPGKLIVMPDQAMSQQYLYTDMMNGTFYAVTRIKTLAPFNNYSAEQFKKSIDSLLYEYIPGNILSLKPILVNGLNGYDIANRTRRGDLQYYRIIFSSLELFIAKVGGKENYVKKNGLQFIKSFQVNIIQPQPQAQAFHNTNDGFEINLNAPIVSNVERTALENYSPHVHIYQAEKSKVRYFILKQTKINSGYFEEDSIELNMVERGFIDGTGYKCHSRNYTTLNGFPKLSCTYSHTNGKQIHAFYLLRGPHVYIFSAWAENESGIDVAKEAFKSFRLTPVISKEGKQIKDTIHHFITISSVKMPPDLNMYGSAFKKRESKNQHRSHTEFVHYNDGVTGERVTLKWHRMNKYYSDKDTVAFWKNELKDDEGDFIISKTYSVKDGVMYADVLYTDTNSSRLLLNKVFVKGRYIYTISNLTDTLTKGNNFVRQFISGFQITDTTNGFNVFEDKTKLFLADLVSDDSATYATARDLFSSLTLHGKSYKPLAETYSKLKDDKFRKELQTDLLAEIGYTRDQAAIPFLRDVYKKSSDDYDIQLSVLRALAALNSNLSYKTCKELLVNDPPFASENYAYRRLFDYIQNDDTLWYRKVFLPDVLKLAVNDEYKTHVYDLLAEAIDSNKIAAESYQGYLPAIIADARKAVRIEMTKDNKSGVNYDLSIYNRILIKHYDENAEVRDYFDKQLKAKNHHVKSSALAIMLSQKKALHDSILYNMSSNPDQRLTLYWALKKHKIETKMPLEFRSQSALAYCFARSNVKPYYGDNTLDSLIMLDSAFTYFKGQSGRIYFYKFKLKKSDDWDTYVCGMFDAENNLYGFTRILNGKGAAFDDKKTIAEQFFTLVESNKEAKRGRGDDYEYDFYNEYADYDE